MIMDMYGESALVFPYFQQQQQQQQQSSFFSFPFPFSPLEEHVQVHHHPLHSPAAGSNLVQNTVSAYDLGGDLFKAPQPIMEEPGLGLDPMAMVSIISSAEDITRESVNVSDISSTQSGHLYETSNLIECNKGREGDPSKAQALVMEDHILGYDPMTVAISKISCGEEILSQMVKVADIKSFQRECLPTELSYGWEELLTKSVMDGTFSKASDVNIPAAMREEDFAAEIEGTIAGSSMHKSFSSGSLSSMECIVGRAMRPSILELQTMDFGAAIGMRRAFSEGDIQTLGNGYTFGHSPLELMLTVGSYTCEERKLRLSRYRIKKAKRNFGRKIKYACRKALADSQPRVRGRFARAEGNFISDTSEKQSRCHLDASRDAVRDITGTGNPNLELGRNTQGSHCHQETTTTGSAYLIR